MHASPLTRAPGFSLVDQKGRVHTLAEFRELFEGGLVDVVQADLTHVGGFPAMRKLAGWADVYGALLAPHNVCGPVGTMANVHFAVATPNYKILEHFNDFADAWVHDLVDHPARVDASDGCFAIPDRPGLGRRGNRRNRPGTATSRDSPIGPTSVGA